MALPIELYVTANTVEATWAAIRPNAVDDPWLRLAWNGSEFRIADHVDLGAISASAIAYSTRLLFQNASRVAPLMQAMHRLHLSSPGNFGLVPHPIEEHARVATMSVDGTLLLSDSKTLAEDLKGDIFFRMLTESSARGSVGWFAPEADPTEFGTPYLLPALAHSDADILWTISYVGLNRTARTLENTEVSWRETGDIRRLVEEISAMDAEYVETVAVLTNSTLYQRDLSRFTLERDRKAAKEAFTPRKRRVKPKLTSNAVDRARSRAHIAAETRTGSYAMVRFSTEDLNGSVTDGPPLHAAAKVTVTLTGDQTFVSDYLGRFEAALVEELRAGGLGTLLRETSDAKTEARYWITTAVDTFTDHLNAFLRGRQGPVHPVVGAHG